MLGAIAGDIIGSVHEHAGTKTQDFPLFAGHNRFTDDTVLTLAVAEHLLSGGNLVDLFHDYFHRYPDAGYGGTFSHWAFNRQREPYNSWGNGSAMRVSPVGFVAESLEAAITMAEATAAVTHDHPEGVRGAQAVAAAVFLARQGESKANIRTQVEMRFGYNLSASLDAIREHYRFDVSCQGSVQQSLIAFLEADDYEGAVRNAVSLGGDADTMACIAGGVAEAFFGGIPEHIAQHVRELLDDGQLDTLSRFRARFGWPRGSL